MGQECAVWDPWQICHFPGYFLLLRLSQLWMLLAIIAPAWLRLNEWEAHFICTTHKCSDPNHIQNAFVLMGQQTENYSHFFFNRADWCEMTDHFKVYQVEKHASSPLPTLTTWGHFFFVCFWGIAPAEKIIPDNGSQLRRAVMQLSQLAWFWFSLKHEATTILISWKQK